MGVTSSVSFLQEFVLPFLVFAAGNLVMAYSAYRLTATLFFSSRIGERALTFVFLIIAQISLALTLAGALGILTLAAVLVEIAIFAVLVIWLTRARGSAAAPASFPAELRRYWIAAWNVATATLPARLMTFVLIAYSGTFLVLNQQTPPFSTDVLNYHFPIVVDALRTHSLLHYQQMMPNELHFYPINGNLIAAWTALPFGDDFLLRFFQAPFPVLIMLAFFVLARRLKVTSAPAYMIACILVCFPWVIQRSFLDRGIDEIYIFSAMVLAFYSIAFLEKPDYAEAVLVGLSAGFFLGGKYLSLSFLPGFVFIWLYVYLKKVENRETAPGASHNRIPFGAAAAIVSGGLLIWGSLVYLRNWILEGSPIFPGFLPLITRSRNIPQQHLELPQFWFQARQWLHGGGIPVYHSALMALAVADLAFVLIKLWNDRVQVSTRVAAWGLLISLFMYSVYPLLDHSRYIMGVVFSVLALWAASLRDSRLLAGKLFLWLCLLAGLLLLGLTLRSPNTQFWEFYTPEMMRFSVAGGVIILLVFWLFDLRAVRNLVGRVKAGWRMAILIPALIAGFWAVDTFAYQPYFERKSDFYAKHFHPVYQWIEEHTAGRGRRILNLDLITGNYLVCGNRFQNLLYRPSTYREEGWTRENYLRYLQDNRIEWILYRSVQMRDRRDFNTAVVTYGDRRSLSFPCTYFPEHMEWMRADPQHFRLIYNQNDAYIFQFSAEPDTSAAPSPGSADQVVNG